MPVNYDAIRAWEKSGPFMHVMVLDRGDLSPANRLTFTDKPYVDKGVAGVFYHDTYPAPLAAIDPEQDIVVHESETGTRFDDIVLNVGDLGATLTSVALLGHEFVMYRGSPEWSLLEEDYPNRFIEIFRGQVDSFKFEQGVSKVRLSISPRKLNFSNLVAGVDTPVALGKCRQVSGLHVAGTSRYKFNSVLTDDDASNFELRDSGNVLAYPAAYTKVLESGDFLGEIELTGADPVGKLTMDINQDSNDYWNRWDNLIKTVIKDFLVSSYPAQEGELDVSSQSSGMRGMAFNSDLSKMYLVDSPNVYQYSVSSENVKDATFDFAENVGSGHNTMCMFGGDLRAFIGSNTSIRSLTLTAAGDISTQSDDGKSFDVFSEIGGAIIIDFTCSDSGDVIVVVVFKSSSYYLYHFDLSVPGDLDTMVLDLSKTLNLTFFDSTIVSAKFADSGSRFYLTGRFGVYQFDLTDAYDIDTLMYRRKAFIPNILRGENTRIFQVSPTGDHFYFGWKYEGTSDFEKIKQFQCESSFDLVESLFLSNLGDAVDKHCGVFYSSSIEVGRILGDLVRSNGADYAVDRFGQIRVTRRKDPNDTPDAWEIDTPVYYGDFLGEQGRHCRHSQVLPPTRWTHVEYDHNFSVQSEADLAGTVSADDKALFSEPYKETKNVNTLPEYQNLEDQRFSTFISDYGDATVLRGEMQSLTNEPRYLHTLNLTLHCISLLSSFGVGSLVYAADDWRYFLIPENSRAMVIAESLNFSANQRTLGVYV